MKRVPKVADLDRRLLVAGRTPIALRGVVVDHETPGGVCPGCRWVLDTGQRGCPSWSIARAILASRVVPAWLGHLAEEVPGAHAPVRRDRAIELAIERAAEDALPGLFAPLPRQDLTGTRVITA
jgi:hypothetical protein